MHRTDLDTPMLTSTSRSVGTPSRFVRITCSGILIISCTIFGFAQCYAQDVAEAARQAKARKENQQKPKHVYTDEDLKKAQILTPEDRAEVEARKKQQPLPGAPPPQEPVDAQAFPAELPLGDVARQYRALREMLHLQQSAEFHLPFSDVPVFAAPKLLEPVAPEAPMAPEAAVPAAAKHPIVPRTIIVIPAEPKIEPYQPSVKRSPFERPRVYLSAPPRTVRPSVNQAPVPKAPAVGEAPSQPSSISVAPSKPAAPSHNINAALSPRLTPRPTTAPSASPEIHLKFSNPSTLPSATASKPAAPAPDLSVMPSPRVAPHAAAQPAAPAVRSTPSLSAALPSATSKPAAPAPDLSVKSLPRTAPHSVAVQPAAPVVPSAPAQPSEIVAAPSQPAAPALDFSVMPESPRAPKVTLAQPVAPVVRALPAVPSPLHVAPSQPAAPVVEVIPARPAVVAAAPAEPVAPIAPTAPAKLNVLVVKPGDSLWKLAEENLGHGLLWRELLAVNPAIVNANHIEAGSQIFLPAIAASHRTATTIIVHKGDTLSQIAQSQLGHASYASCVAQANPAVRDANRIYAGQLLQLPTTCKP